MERATRTLTAEGVQDAASTCGVEDVPGSLARWVEALAAGGDAACSPLHPWERELLRRVLVARLGAVE